MKQTLTAILFLFLLFTHSSSASEDYRFFANDLPTGYERPTFEGGSKELGKHLTSLFVFEKEPVSEFCYYNVAISAEGAVLSVEKSICSKHDILNESVYNEKSLREIFTKYCVWIPAKKDGVAIEDVLSIYVKIYKKKIVVYF